MFGWSAARSRELVRDLFTHEFTYGMVATYAGLDRTVREWRGKQRHERRSDADRLWGGRKEAEEL